MNLSQVRVRSVAAPTGKSFRLIRACAWCGGKADMHLKSDNQTTMHSMDLQ